MSFDVQFPGLGLEFTINRVALSIGGFNIYWYGVIIDRKSTRLNSSH